MIPKTLKLFRVAGPLTSKTGSQFYLGFAECPNPLPGGFSTLRVTVVSGRALVVGEEIPATSVTQLDFEKGEARGRV